MVLSNAERQARYRERLKQLAAKGVMSPMQAKVLSDVRGHLRGWRRSVAGFAEGRMRLTTDNVDTTKEHVSMLKSMIARNEALLAEYDPDGLTADGNIEIGDVSTNESGGVLPGRWISYELDEQGRAVSLRLYDAEAHARTDAMIGDRYVGQVANDMWSILPLSGRTVYALIQPMANDWWKALVSGWSDLAEQYGASRELAIKEITAVAQEYVRERNDRGIPVPKSTPIALRGWACIPITIDE